MRSRFDEALALTPTRRSVLRAAATTPFALGVLAGLVLFFHVAVADAALLLVAVTFSAAKPFATFLALRRLRDPKKIGDVLHVGNTVDMAYSLVLLALVGAAFILRLDLTQAALLGMIVIWLLIAGPRYVVRRPWQRVAGDAAWPEFIPSPEVRLRVKRAKIVGLIVAYVPACLWGFGLMAAPAAAALALGGAAIATLLTFLLVAIKLPDRCVVPYAPQDGAKQEGAENGAPKQSADPLADGQ